MPSKHIYKEILPWLDRQKVAARTKEERERLYHLEDRLCRRSNQGNATVNVPHRWGIRDLERAVGTGKYTTGNAGRGGGRTR